MSHSESVAGSHYLCDDNAINTCFVTDMPFTKPVLIKWSSWSHVGGCAGYMHAGIENDSRQ